MFGWIKDTKVGKAMQEWAEVWQPTYDNISEWKTIKDIGTFKPEVIAEWQEAWAVIPAPQQKQIVKVFNLLKKLIDTEILAKIVELYLNYIKAKNT